MSVKLTVLWKGKGSAGASLGSLAEGVSASALQGVLHQSGRAAAVTIERADLERLLAERAGGPRSALNAVRDGYAEIGLMREQGVPWVEIAEVLGRNGAVGRDGRFFAPATVRSAFFLVGAELRQTQTEAQNDGGAVPVGDPAVLADDKSEASERCVPGMVDAICDEEGEEPLDALEPMPQEGTDLLDACDDGVTAMVEEVWSPAVVEPTGVMEDAEACAAEEPEPPDDDHRPFTPNDAVAPAPALSPAVPEVPWRVPPRLDARPMSMAAQDDMMLLRPVERFVVPVAAPASMSRPIVKPIAVPEVDVPRQRPAAEPTPQPASLPEALSESPLAHEPEPEHVVAQVQAIAPGVGEVGGEGPRSTGIGRLNHQTAMTLDWTRRIDSST